MRYSLLAANTTEFEFKFGYRPEHLMAGLALLGRLIAFRCIDPQ
jgi:hypothetical protein